MHGAALSTWLGFQGFRAFRDLWFREPLLPFSSASPEPVAFHRSASTLGHCLFPGVEDTLDIAAQIADRAAGFGLSLLASAVLVTFANA